MKKFLIITLFTLQFSFSPSRSYCDDSKLSIAGYYKNMTAATKSNVNNNHFFGSINRLRLEFKKSIASWQFNLTLDNEGLIHDFKNEPDFAFVETRTQNPTAFLDWDQVSVDKKHLYLKHTIHRAFIKYYSPRFQAIAGKQAVDWGKMRFFSPLDIFNAIRPTDVEPDERMGIDAINLNFSHNSFTGLNVVYSQGEDSDTTNIGIKAYGKVSTYDLSVILASANKQRTAGFAFDGYIKDAGFRGEISYAKADFDRDRSYFRTAVGMDYNFPNKVYLLFEQFYNGGHERSFPNLISFSNRRYRKILSLQKHLSSIFTSYEVTPLIKLQNSLIYDWEGNSVTVNPEIKYDMFENVELTLGAQIYSDKTDSLLTTDNEFGVYENAYYVRFKWFF